MSTGEKICIATSAYILIICVLLLVLQLSPTPQANDSDSISIEMSYIDNDSSRLIRISVNDSVCIHMAEPCSSIDELTVSGDTAFFIIDKPGIKDTLIVPISKH